MNKFNSERIDSRKDSYKRRKYLVGSMASLSLVMACSNEGGEIDRPSDSITYSKEIE